MLHGLMLVPVASPVLKSSECTPSLGEEQLAGISGSSLRGWGWSASRYSLEVFHKAKHDYELEQLQRQQTADRIHVHMDCFHMGLAGYDSWSPNVDEEFLYHLTEPSTMEVALIPIHKINSIRFIFCLRSFIPLTVIFFSFCFLSDRLTRNWNMFTAILEVKKRNIFFCKRYYFSFHIEILRWNCCTARYSVGWLMRPTAVTIV